MTDEAVPTNLPGDIPDGIGENQAAPRFSLLATAATGFAAVVFALLFGRPIAETYRICWNNEDYSHGLLLPFISAYLLWQTAQSRKKFTSAHPVAPGFSFLGFVLLLIGLILLFLGEISDLLFFGWAGFFPALLGSLLLLFGHRSVSPYAGALLLNFMAKPLPDSVVPKLFFPLQVFAAKVSAETLDLLQVPVYLKGNVIEIPGMQLMVEEACSGMRSLMALLTVAIIVLLSLEVPRFAKLFIFLLAVAIAISLNVVRVASTGVLAHFYDPRAASGFFHTFSGMVVFVLGLIILYSVGSWIERVSKRRKKEA